MSLRRKVPVTYRWARRIAVAVVGGTVLLVGVALIVLPGPALVVIPIGLAILGLEFAWARLWLRRVKQRSAQVVNYFRTDNRK
jgi:tellurite resistance protein TerC